MRKRTIGRLMMTSLLAAALWGQDARAGAHPLQVREYAEGLYYIEYTGAPTREEAQLAGLAEIDGTYREAGNLAYLSPMTGDFQGGLYGFVLRKDDFDRILEIHGACQGWLAANMPAIVREGTPWKEAVLDCAHWVADHMRYDETALTDMEKLCYYQSALGCFFGGTGVCATYATAFDAMVSYLPIDCATGKVTYTGAGTRHLDTRYVSNGAHQWSAVWEEDGWHFYDITFYDSSGRPEYLDMTAGAFADGKHDGVITRFDPAENVFVFRQET